MITAKVKCTSKTVQGEPGDAGRFAQVAFAADYADGRNAEWALATPHLTVNMTLNGQAADLFDQGTAYTLQFVESDD
ncbi:hypothetical protein SAMN05421837_107347 [Amycolatopsis pretoriensis]|uniref:Uncharacterized protein n=1 Tax=Amycolatopsis pretoriensis TaxID=218821 RepID=A0A1H5R7J4_9PSEU|nr:hypothetical protein [Amycolatopsis pretoriensis]SEF34376.1 hypothetical protein SAMN05421837_107347 [Amycolatopsis pretoriensis]